MLKYINIGFTHQELTKYKELGGFGEKSVPGPSSRNNPHFITLVSMGKLVQSYVLTVASPRTACIQKVLL